MKKLLGWIKLWRVEIDTTLFQQKPYDEWHAWKWIEMSASWDDGELTKKGELLTSLKKMMKEFGWSKRAVQGFLLKLAKKGLIAVQTNKNEPKSGTKIILISSQKQRFSGTKSVTKNGTNMIIDNNYHYYHNQKEEADGDACLNGSTPPPEEDDESEWSYGVKL